MTEYRQKYKCLNRKKRKLELIRRRNKIRKWPECWHTQFFTNLDIGHPQYGGAWIDFWFYGNSSKHVVVVSMDTVSAAAEMESLDETLDNSEYTPSGVLASMPLFDNEFFYKEREIFPSIIVKRLSNVVTRILVRCTHDKITEKEIHDFIDDYRRSNEFRTTANVGEKAKYWEVRFPPVKIAARRRA